MLCGRVPFGGDNTKQIVHNILMTEIEFKHEAFNKISESGKDLIRKMCEKDPDERIELHQVLNHQWFKEEQNRWEYGITITE